MTVVRLAHNYNVANCMNKKIFTRKYVHLHIKYMTIYDYIILSLPTPNAARTDKDLEHSSTDCLLSGLVARAGLGSPHSTHRHFVIKQINNISILFLILIYDS